MRPYLIILADDHAMFRSGVRKILEEQRNLKIIGEASDGLALLQMLKECTPDLIILDITMPKMRGIEATKEIKSFNPNIKILILSMHKDHEYLYHALSAGADGYLLKNDADSELSSAIESVRHNRTYISPSLQREITDDLVQLCRGTMPSLMSDPLTTREKEVLKLIAEGHTNREIAESLFISVRTVEHHRANIMSKLNINKISDLVKYALLKGYTSETR